MKWLFGFLALTWWVGAVAAVEEKVDWQSFLAGHDPVWERMGKAWWEAPFVGDGDRGMMVRLGGDRKLVFEVGHARVQDHRTDDLWKGGIPDAVEVQNRGRLPIGRFELSTVGKIDPTKSTARIDLWNAEARGVLATDRGKIVWRVFIHAKDGAGVIDLMRSDGESAAALVFIAQDAISPREKNLPADMRAARKPNPKPRSEGDAKKGRVVQDLVAGGQTATAWQRVGDGRWFWTIEHRFPESDAGTRAEATVARAAGSDFLVWQASHRQWWHDWYPRSFFSFGDPYWESFYWIQIYKMASATRADRALIDNSGPWLQPSGWCATWWNLNVQLSYSPFYASGRSAEAEALPRHLAAGMDALVRSVDEKYRADSAALCRNTGADLFGWAGQPGGRALRERKDIGMETGNLPWACHNLYRHYRVTMDEKMGRELLFPLLRRSVNYYRHFLKEGADGRLHLPKTHSPEYGEAADANYDLAGLVWGCRTLLELDAVFGIKDPLVPEWRKLLEKLVPFPRDAVSYHIGAAMPYERSHRHWSHLMMIYPYGVVTPESDGVEWIRGNLDHWHSKKGAHQGYSFTGGIAMSAMFGDGDRAQRLLDGFRPFLNPNTLYREGGSAPVMETPLHGAAVLQDMAFRSQNGVIHVFPATSPKWERTVFRGFTAEGGFVVDAGAERGRLCWLELAAPFGGEVVLECDGIGDLKRAIRGAKVEVLGSDRLRLSCDKGGRITLGDTAVVRPVGGPGTNPFGLK
ncbi:MAG: alpha-L-fucosidase [Verrucomicrobia bacterium]|nr:MAG: alpha-L-fucosidase [Verrucomicrobiota bacterium]TAE85665.1 MAG: alpha-L-fucosidase [Verrucomicrobiota bacterium]TAF23267.1 MAG: alpha-L-fucosidase [Verrucomicrobiota bacterium]